MNCRATTRDGRLRTRRGARSAPQDHGDPSHPIALLVDKPPGLSHILKLALESFESQIGFAVSGIHLQIFLKVLNF